jgi:hypothetical protein
MIVIAIPNTTSYTQSVSLTQPYKAESEYFSYLSPQAQSIYLRKLYYNQRFFELLRLWKRDTQFSSSYDEIVSNRYYRAIEKEGEPMVPYLIDELRSNPDYWFDALSKITGEDPVLPEHYGDLLAMSQDWIHHAESKNFKEKWLPTED